MRLARALLVMFLVFTAAACGGSSKSSSSSSSGPEALGTVTIKDFTFKPNQVAVRAGATVTVKNTDGVDHTMTSNDKRSFDTKHVGGGKSASFTAPAAAGTYPFHCNIHQFMTGALIVT